jgi:Fe-S cluster assembly scaffold protein SufB
MSTRPSDVETLYAKTGTGTSILNDPDVAHLTVNHNKVLTSHTLEGLDIDVKEIEDGIDVRLVLRRDVRIKKTVHMCFGMIPTEGVQRIRMKVDLEKNSAISVLAHCVFPNAVDVQHIMDAQIEVGEGARYSYMEKHVHGKTGGIKVYPKAAIHLARGANFKTEFELLHGRVGLIDVEYETTCEAESVMDVTARINGIEDDFIKINEIGHLVGEKARGALTSKIAISDKARAEIYNTLTASAPYARGHVDCKEIVRGQATAMAVPTVKVNHPRAHVTHEAAIGSVDTKQLETLMSRGLDEDEASDLIIQGLLS